MDGVILNKGGIGEMFWRDQKKGGPGKRTLFSNVKAMRTIRIIVSTTEELPKHRIVTADKT